MTQEDAEARVKENYVLLNLDYIEFESVTNTKEEAMPLSELLGILGGPYVYIVRIDL